MTQLDVHLSHGSVRVVDCGAGPALVLIHGLGGTWRNWSANLATLAQHHRVIALDLPGFGDSAPYTGEVTVQRYVETVVELLDERGVDEATFVGNSMGGLLTIETATRYPKLVSAAVLVCSGGIPLVSARDRLIAIPLARLTNRVLRTRFARRLILRSRRVRRILGGQIFHDPTTVEPELLAEALGGLGAVGFGPALTAANVYDARQSAPTLACPTLVLCGRDDPLLPVAMGHELQRLIPGASLEIWEQTGHCPMLEDPARFDALVSTFVVENIPAGLNRD